MGSQCSKKFRPTPQIKLPISKKTSTLEELEMDMDDNMVDMADFFERPPNEKKFPRPKQTNSLQLMTQEQCPTPQNSPTYVPMKNPNHSSNTCQTPPN